ncbi:MAG: ATPase, T2SS/T4P/T4SS family [Hadesarchaea archaeon]|nr:ATPase, T2SS/T4P/T4SS family [Hadesarchaea archaeon]
MVGPASFEVKESGPLKVAEFDCHGCEGLCTLTDPRCRADVIDKLRTEGEVDQVILTGPICRVYCSRELSKLARTIAAAQQLALDRTLYAAKEEEKRCVKCINERTILVMKALDQIVANPHDLGPLDDLVANARKKLKGECKGCTDEHFAKLVESIKSTLKGADILKRLSPTNYDAVFIARMRPFFVEGVWHPPPRQASLIESYELSDKRGKVRIYERPSSPVPYYELDLPEFKLPVEQLGLLDAAFRVKIEEAPGHARFAYSTRMRSFAEEWYNTLLHMLREEESSVPTTELQKLAKLMAAWLTYRVLEPLNHDDRITDIYIPAPPELQPIVVEHERWGKCETGIYLTTPSLLGLGETLASRLGTAFDEVHPQLDAEIPELGMRLFLSRYPAIWSRSVEIAIRRRRSTPWTQPLFLDRGTLTPLASSVLGNVLRLGSSAFVIGEMGTAKTSQVETYIPEIGPQQRIVAFQDTEELHIEDFVKHGYKLANVRVSDPEHLERQVNAFLRGGASYWLITEVRAAEAVRAALGAAARQGSQPVVASFHARSKREMFDLIVHIMGLHEAAFKYIDLIISTARFSTPGGTIRRIVEVAEVLKDWREEPKYAELFVDDRKRDTLVPEKLLSGSKKLIKRLNARDLSKVDVIGAAKKIEFLPPERGGSQLIPQLCKRLAIDEDELLASILAEARMKSDLLGLAKKSGDPSYLELPFTNLVYNAYFSSVKRNAPNYKRVMEDWRVWLKKL